MSCQIRAFANIIDVTTVRKFLFPKDETKDNWLQCCEVTISPTGDVIALTNDSNLVVLTSKWNENLQSNQYYVTYSKKIHETDNVKSIICLPVVSSKSSHISHEWTCLMIGFESGFVRFYTEDIELLYQEQFHNETITHIKCQSQHNPRPDLSTALHPEEIYIQYQSIICILPGNQLFNLLRKCRLEHQPDLAAASLLQPKKWGFQDQATISDTSVVGIDLHTSFDHLLTASTCGGFETKYRTSPPYGNLVLAVGACPYVGFHYALEGGAQPDLGDVARAVASKLKSALPGWLTGQKPTNEPPSVAVQSVDTMGCRFGLCDLKRTATSIILSPNHRLAAIADALGRVILLDTYRGLALNIFKGYREAQCAFVQVPDDKHSKHRPGNKVALFLIIYSSKKGTIEIFNIQKCVRIATFTASKYSRLIYIDYSLMGFSGTSKSRFVCQLTTVFIDNDGIMKEILVPFHYAYNEKCNDRARDIYLYKKLKKSLKYEDYTPELHQQIIDTCSELKTDEIKQQFFDLLIGNKSMNVELIMECIEILKNEQIYVGMIKNLLEHSEKLLKFYQFNTINKYEENDTENELLVEIKDLKNLQKLLELTRNGDQKKSCNKVVFKDDNHMNPAKFLSIFDITESELNYKEKCDEKFGYDVAEFLFEKYITGDRNDFDELQKQIIETQLSYNYLFKLLLNFWINRPLSNDLNLEKEINNLAQLLYTLIKIADPADIQSDYNTTSKFWTEIREYLSKSSYPFPALIAAILCKIIGIKLENNDLDQAGFDDNLEVLSQEIIEWSILIGKLEDVSLLNIILNKETVASDCDLPKLKYDKIDISLKLILSQGKGSVSKLVARWITPIGLNPENLVMLDEINAEEVDEVVDENEDALPKQKRQIPDDQLARLNTESVYKHLEILRESFPYSLDTNAILADMCWEYALEWQKDIQNLLLIEAALKCLNEIPNPHIKTYLHNLVWNTHLKIIFESTSKLINKVGKLPKSRLCIQDTGLTDQQMITFLDITTNFLENYIKSVWSCKDSSRPILSYEVIWDDSSHDKSLIELALQQNEISLELLELHYQLSLTLKLLTKFAVKHSKPVNNLFEDYMLNVFFMDFQTKIHINYYYAERTKNGRMQFLHKLIDASLEVITVDEHEHIYTQEHVKWMSQCFILARLWNVETDTLRRYQVIQIYTNGYDSFGDELYATVNDTRKLGPELLAVAGRRLSKFLLTSPNLGINMAVLPTAITSYIQSMNDEWCAPGSLKSIENILLRCLNSLDENQTEFRLCEMMLDGCKSLQDIHEN